MRTSGQIHKQHLVFLYSTEKTISNPIKWGMFIMGATLLSYWNWDGVSPAGIAALVAYGVQTLVFTILFSKESFNLRQAKIMILISYMFDFMFVAFLIFGLGGVASQVAFLLYMALIFKAGLYYPAFHKSLAILPLAVFMYLFLLGVREGMQVFADYAVRPRLFMLVAFPAITVYTARLLDYREKGMWELNRLLQIKTDELKRQTKELEAIIDGVRDGLVVTDLEMEVLTANPVGRAILHIGDGAQPPMSLSMNANGLAMREVIAEAVGHLEHTVRREIRLPLPNDQEESPRVYQAVANCIDGSDAGSDRVVIVLRDITEQMRLEEAKSNFLSVVSHELRTPLSSIKGFLNIILSGRSGPLNDTQKDFLSTAKGQAEALHAMISDLVEFSRIQVSRTDLDLGPVSLADMSKSIVSRLRPLAQDKEIQLVNLVPAEFPLLDADLLRLEQVITNLVSNAIKFTPEGGVITIKASMENGEVVFCVSDTGIGIPQDQLENIFEPFYQVSNGLARLHGGMGIGLSICKHVIERHKGRIYAESQEGKGSSFYFTLPSQNVINEQEALGTASNS